MLSERTERDYRQCEQMDAGRAAGAEELGRSPEQWRSMDVLGCLAAGPSFAGGCMRGGPLRPKEGGSGRLVHLIGGMNGIRSNESPLGQGGVSYGEGAGS